MFHTKHFILQSCLLPTLTTLSKKSHSRIYFLSATKQTDELHPFTKRSNQHVSHYVSILQSCLLPTITTLSKKKKAISKLISCLLLNIRACFIRSQNVQISMFHTMYLFYNLVYYLRWCKCERQKKNSNFFSPPFFFQNSRKKIKKIFSYVFPKTAEKIIKNSSVLEKKRWRKEI